MRENGEKAVPDKRAPLLPAGVIASGREKSLLMLFALLLFATASLAVWALFRQPILISFALAGAAGCVFLLGAVAANRARDESNAIPCLLDSLPLAYVLIDEHYRVARMNDRARCLLGLPAGSWTGCAFQTLMGGWTPDSPAGPLPEDGAQWDSARPDSSSAEIRYQLAVLRVGSKKMHLLLLQDIGEITSTFREQSESARIRMAACLATQIAHEIRNPVAAISGSAQLLGILTKKAQRGDERIRHLLLNEQDSLCRSIVEESQRLDEIIARFLSFSDMSEERLRLVMELPEIEGVARKSELAS